MGYATILFCINRGVHVVSKREYINGFEGKRGTKEQKSLEIALCGGFTLIELLVVVIIIGILVAIALPQYNKAVFNSRAAKALVHVRAFDQSQADFYLTHGYYANQWNNLLIKSRSSCPAGSTFCQWTVAKGLMFEIKIAGGRSTGNYYRWYCMAKDGSSLAEQFCSQRGSYSHTNSGYKYYRAKYVSPKEIYYYHAPIHFG